MLSHTITLTAWSMDNPKYTIKMFSAMKLLTIVLALAIVCACSRKAIQDPADLLLPPKREGVIRVVSANIHGLPSRKHSRAKRMHRIGVLMRATRTGFAILSRALNF